jgi:D-3-phosphoglycerate dehydrogenase
VNTKGMKALITCEVSHSFIGDLETRGIRCEHAGWGLNGKLLSPNELITQAKDCEIVITELEELNESIIRQLPKISFIGVTRGNPTNVDLTFCKEQGIEVVYTPGRNADSVADYCIGAILGLTRDINVSNRHLTNFGWMYEEKLPYLRFRGKELGRSTIGLYGMGQIGKRVASRLHRGFGTTVIYFDPFVEKDDNARQVDSLDELFSRSDVVSLHAPVTEETKNTVNTQLLNGLGESGFLINSARADLVVESDLYQSLIETRIAGAALDVFWSEPLHKNSKWLELENVLCTPHIAGASNDVVENQCEMILAGIDIWIKTKQVEKSKENG